MRSDQVCNTGLFASFPLNLFRVRPVTLCVLAVSMSILLARVARFMIPLSTSLFPPLAPNSFADLVYTFVSIAWPCIRKPLMSLLIFFLVQLGCKKNLFGNEMRGNKKTFTKVIFSAVESLLLCGRYVLIFCLNLMTLSL